MGTADMGWGPWEMDGEDGNGVEMRSKGMETMERGWEPQIGDGKEG